MIKIYYFDSNYKSNGENDILFANEDGTYTIPDNATDIAPDQGLYQPFYFNVQEQKWTGTPKEEWQKEHPVENEIETPPTQNEATIGNDSELRQAFGSLQMSSVQTVKMVMDLSKQVAALTKQNVELQKQLNDKGVE